MTNEDESSASAHAPFSAPGGDSDEALSPAFTWTVPEEFRSFGLDVDDEERENRLVELAGELWPGGTEGQREQVVEWYRDIAAAAADDGASYAGICVLETEDGRFSTATLTVRSEPTDRTDSKVAATALHEALSHDERQEVHRVKARFGPAVLVLSELHVTPGSEGGEEQGENEPPGGESSLVFAQVDVYCPLPAVGQLLIFNISTPSLADLPWYVARLSETVDTVELPDAAPGTVSGGTEGRRKPSADGGPGCASGEASPLRQFV